MKTLLLLALFSFNLLAQEEETEALRAMRLSCEKQKVGLGCFNYANMLIRAKKEESADKYFELGCSYKHEPSCKKEKWEGPKDEASPEASAPSGGEEALPESVDLNLDSPDVITE